MLLCYKNESSISQKKKKIYLFIAMIKGIHDGYGMVKVNYLVCLVIIKAREDIKMMKFWVN